MPQAGPEGWVVGHQVFLSICVAEVLVPGWHGLPRERATARAQDCRAGAGSGRPGDDVSPPARGGGVHAEPLRHQPRDPRAEAAGCG